MRNLLVKGLGDILLVQENIWIYNLNLKIATRGLFLYSYLYLKLTKTLCLSYYLLWFLFNKIREQEGGTGSTWKGGGKQCLHMNVYICECKNNKILK
jgi:hypothetical protein